MRFIKLPGLSPVFMLIAISYRQILLAYWFLVLTLLKEEIARLVHILKCAK